MGTNSGNITWNYAPVTPGYYIMKSPENRMPFKVYADGVLLTSGIFGSLADVAFCRNNKLIFRATALFNKSSISIEYKGKLYHYSINCTYNSYPECEENSTWIKAQLLSKVEV